jgi:hypothetical protein
MVAEVLVRRGRPEVAPEWVDGYIRRLDELPRATGEITDESWPEALGDGRRIGDWTAYFTRQLAGPPWRQVLAAYAPPAGSAPTSQPAVPAGPGAVAEVLDRAGTKWRSRSPITQGGQTWRRSECTSSSALMA